MLATAVIGVVIQVQGVLGGIDKAVRRVIRRQAESRCKLVHGPQVGADLPGSPHSQEL